MISDIVKALSNAEARSVEAQANCYASQLILPDYLVEPWVEGKRATLDVASGVANDLNASLTAAAIKLTKSSITPACLACHGQSKLVWSPRNMTFPSGFYVTRELHNDTDAFRIAFGGAKGISRSRREPAGCWIAGAGASRLTVESQSIKPPDGTVLTLFTRSGLRNRDRSPVRGFASRSRRESAGVSRRSGELSQRRARAEDACPATGAGS